MSDAVITQTPEQAEKNKQFLEDYKAQPEEAHRIQRKSKLARFTHASTVVTCILLAISGLFVFIPPLTQMLPADAVFAIRMSHRVFGVIFIVVPIISAIVAPNGLKHILKNLFHPWNKDDKKWLALFMPYLFMAKHLHMPDQDETKSGQRFSDGLIWLACLIMAVSGLILLLGTTVFDLGPAYRVVLFFHDLGFLMIAILGLAHIFVAGVFQPYRGMARVMWGDGTISESDALYHWGHWVRKEADKKHAEKK